MFHKKIPQGTKLPVSFAVADVEMMRYELCLAPSFLAAGVVKGDQIAFRFSLDDIEELQGAVAAESNHAKDAKLRKRLDRIFVYLQEFLDTYDDQGDS